jgi:ribosomal protein S18 acetylase RimI-like enzyme
MTVIIQATREHLLPVRELFWDYMQWANAGLQREYGISFDIAAMLENDLSEIDKFFPPKGRLLLALDEGAVAGCACLRTHHPQVAELKRMYVRPSSRQKGHGRALVAALIADIQEAGYTTLRLDSARFMHQAHALYRAMGFREIEPYAESEIPPEFRKHWVFMERSLSQPLPA